MFRSSSEIRCPRCERQSLAGNFDLSNDIRLGVATGKCPWCDLIFDVKIEVCFVSPETFAVVSEFGDGDWRRIDAVPVGIWEGG